MSEIFMKLRIKNMLEEKNEVYQLALRQIDNLSGLIEKEFEK